MTPAKQKRKKKTSKDCRVKQGPGAIKCNVNSNTVRTGYVVCVTSVPSTLCANERTVRDFFAEYGMLLSVTIHHNFLDMEPDGFMYLEYSEKEEAENAIAAVKEKSVGLAACIDVKLERAVLPSEITGMEAVMALSRGESKVEVDEEIKDILLGRQELNRFTQSQQDPTDEDDLILQSLSQHSFANSQSKKKKKKRRHENEDGVPVSGRPKKAQKTRSNKVAVPTE